MKLIETDFDGLFVIEPTIFEDERGYFYETYNRKKYEEIGISCDFVQDNESKSKYGTIRGLHFQGGKFAQAKLVRAQQGKVLDVIVDIRKNSKTFGKYFSIELSDENRLQLFIPRGFAHGFSVLSDVAIFSYKCDNFYNKGSEDGILYGDIDLNINWKIKKSDEIVSEKDKQYQTFGNFVKNM
ncbi:MAG: dTDP-4-dehydrorhamnose 3,5-epimerase [Rickettsiales bacterium]|jgi:dTDP-4-dehydrorhamnose 3,5-epimerase|nr:dTDP-4-dehydrorhamnose 3,5-epimerase [Rickettsiales bacterium]